MHGTNVLSASPPGEPCRFLEDVLVLNDDMMHRLRVECIQQVALHECLREHSRPSFQTLAQTHPEPVAQPHDRTVLLTQAPVELEARLSVVQLLDVTCRQDVSYMRYQIYSAKDRKTYRR